MAPRTHPGMKRPFCPKGKKRSRSLRSLGLASIKTSIRTMISCCAGTVNRLRPLFIVGIVAYNNRMNRCPCHTSGRPRPKIPASLLRSRRVCEPFEDQVAFLRQPMAYDGMENKETTGNCFWFEYETHVLISYVPGTCFSYFFPWFCL